MAVNEIQVGRQNAVLHKLLAMKEGAPSPILAPEVIPVLVLESDRPEWAFLAGEALCWGFVEPGAVVGQIAYCELRNPAGSGVLCVVEEVVLASATASAFFALGIGSYAPLSAASASIVRDTRILPGRPSCSLASINTAASPGGINGYKILQSTGSDPVIIRTPIILSPGTLLAIQTTNMNIGIRVSVSWRERTLEPSETR